MLIAYIISVIVCFVMGVLACKYHDGKLTTLDLFICIGLSLVPGFNIVCAIVATIACLDAIYRSKILDKKIW